MKRLTLALLLAALPVAGAAADHPQASRIVSIGGSVTEILFAIGAGDRVIARDSTSLYPARVQTLPDVGYMRQLSAEGVLSTAPDLVITRDGAGPPEALDQLKGAAVPLETVHDGFTADSVVQAIRRIGGIVGRPDAAETLARQEEAGFDALAQQVAGGPHPGVLFVLSDRSGRLMVAGRDTGADGLIRLAGARNVMHDGFHGYRTVSDEAIIAAAPDAIVMMTPTDGPGMAADDASVLDLPAVQRTPAGAERALIRVDPAALGFGPRTADFARGLRRALLAAGD